MTMRTTDFSEAKACLLGLPQPVLCAVSGGRDSMCLLHLLSHWGRQQGIKVAAAHYNHHLRETAARDEAFVRKICADWGIPLVCGGGEVRAFAQETGKTLEEAGREKRYAFLEQARQESGCAAILTAHHADDNAETMLLNLLRGTGLQGLTGIPGRRDKIYRPLLSVTGAEIGEYAQENAVPFVEDETNALDDASRNLLRHKVLPVLRELNPRAVENLSRTAALLAEDARALELAAGKALNKAAVLPGERAEIPIDLCRKEPKAVVSRAVLSVLVSVGGHQKDLTARHVESVLALARGGEEKSVSLPYGLTARRKTDTIFIGKTAPVPGEVPIACGERVDFGDWSVTLSKEPQAGESWAVPAAFPMTVTVWRPSDRMTVPGSRGSRSVKRLYAERGVAPHERDGLPVLRGGERPLAAARIGANLEVAPQREEAALYVTFQKSERIKEKDYEK